MIIGGDAFVAAFLVALLQSGTSNITTDALRNGTQMAGAALQLALGLPLGASLSPLDVKPSSYTALPDFVRTNPLDAVKRNLAGGADVFWKGGVVAPKGGALREQFEKLEGMITNWTKRPGSDLIAIFGESRCGKEFPLEKLLVSLGRKFLRPVNMFQFLQDPGKIINHVKYEGTLFEREHPGVGSARSVLILDEVMPGDAGRALLNLTAEKIHRAFSHPRDDADFTDHLVIILSSIERDRLLSDLHGRLLGYIEIPPLRERGEEIPYVLLHNLCKGVGDVSSVKVGFRALSALMSHDYRARTGPGVEPGTGLNQQNFRALQDILSFAYRGAEGRSRDTDGDVRITTADLPEPLRVLAHGIETDDQGVRYTLTPDSSGKKVESRAPYP